MKFLSGLVYAALCLSLSSVAGAAEVYYVSLFSFQDAESTPRYTHSFASFVKATGEGSDPSTYTTESHTISWLPQSLEVRALRFHPQPAVNLDLISTLNLALDVSRRNGIPMRISQWGPYQIQPVLYERSLAQLQRLQSGFGYVVVDLATRTWSATNCMHAVSDTMMNDVGLLKTGDARGEVATWLITRYLSRWFVGGSAGNGWLNERLGISGYAIQPMNY